MVTRRGRWGCLASIAVVPMLWIWASGYLDGWNLVPPMRGVVVDGQTGEPLAGARAWRWWVRDEVGGARLSPGGFNTGYPSTSVEGTTDAHGQFKAGGLAALHAVTGMGLAVYMPGYGLNSFERVGELEYQGDGVRVWRKGWTLRVEVRMQRLGRSPQAWAAHLGAIDALTQYGYPLPRDLLLDEAYRYVSQGGEITEGTARILFDCPGVTYLPVGAKTDAIECALLSYCSGPCSEASICSRKHNYLPVWRKRLDCSGQQGAELARR